MKDKDLIEILPRHACGLIISHNEHKNMYQSVDQYVDHNAHDFYGGDAEYDLAVANDELWEIQWYPDTPVGFHVIRTASLGKLLEALADFQRQAARIGSKQVQ